MPRDSDVQTDSFQFGLTNLNETWKMACIYEDLALIALGPTRVKAKVTVSKNRKTVSVNS